MWLKAKIMNALLADHRITRRELAREVGCSLRYLNRIIDGEVDAGMEVSRLLIAAFGAADMEKAIDWQRCA